MDGLTAVYAYLLIMYVYLGLCTAQLMKLKKMPVWMRFNALFLWPVYVIGYIILGCVDIFKMIVNIFRD